MIRPVAQRSDQDAPSRQGWTRPIAGNPRAPILVVSDTQSAEAATNGTTMDKAGAALVQQVATDNGFERDDFLFVSLAPQIAKQDLNSASRKWKHVEPHVNAIQEAIQKYQPRIVLTFGELATRAVIGRSVKITKARGQAIVKEGLPPVFPMLSPGFVNRIPDHRTTFNADFTTLSRIKAADYDVDAVQVANVNYEWSWDLSWMLADRPKMVAFDTETTGLRWYAPEVRVIAATLCWRPGHAVAVALDPIYIRRWWPEKADQAEEIAETLRGQLKTLLEDPSVKKMAHNLKFDHQMARKEGIEVQGWAHDTQLLAFQTDENMMEMALDAVTRIFVPEMAGYCDAFDRYHDKSDMRAAPPEDTLDAEGKVSVPGMLNYACGDVDATYRIARKLLPRLKQDARQYNAYRRVQMPALLVFANTVERYGLDVDTTHLRVLEGQLKDWLRDEYRALIRMVPAKIKRKHLNLGKDLKFSRPDFVRDVLFSKQGFGLKPVMYTDATKDLPPAQRQPATGKDHLQYFVTDEKAGEFCTRLVEYGKTQRMLSTYVGEAEEGTGFWQYLSQGSTIYPSYGLHFTNTGRTASRSPNGQNFPKRGRWAKEFAKVFKPRPGYTFVAVDLSQIELRLAGWMSGDRTMIDIYRNGGDIHMTTAEGTMGLPMGTMARYKGDETPVADLAQALRWPGLREFYLNLSPEQKRSATIGDFVGLQRFKAKAVNFGFVYGQSANGFRVYAKTNYGIDYTEEAAVETRDGFFRTYRSLLPWHESMKAFVHQHGYVRSLHGTIRHLPSIWSNDRGQVAQAERQAVNAPIQRFGSDLGLVAAIRFSHQVDPREARILAFIHDQLVLEVRQGMEEDYAAYLKWVMDNPPLENWFGISAPLPILGDAEIAEPDENGKITLASLKERKGIQPIKPPFWNDDEAAAARAFEAINWELAHAA